MAIGFGRKREATGRGASVAALLQNDVLILSAGSAWSSLCFAASQLLHLWLVEEACVCGHVGLVHVLVLVDELGIELWVLSHPSPDSLVTHHIHRHLLLLRHLNLLGSLLFHEAWNCFSTLRSHLRSPSVSLDLCVLLHAVQLVLNLLALEVIL